MTLIATEVGEGADADRIAALDLQATFAAEALQRATIQLRSCEMRTFLGLPMLLSIALLATPSLAHSQLPPDLATLQVRQTVFAPSLHVAPASSRQTLA